LSKKDPHQAPIIIPVGIYPSLSSLEDPSSLPSSKPFEEKKIAAAAAKPKTKF
jgi:hypothetical protein